MRIVAQAMLSSDYHVVDEVRAPEYMGDLVEAIGNPQIYFNGHYFDGRCFEKLGVGD